MPISISGDGPITGITSLNTTVSSTELGYLDGTTSAIQTQINSSGGLVKVTSGTFSLTGTSIPVSDCFSSAYKNYKVLFNISTSASTGFSMRFRTGAGDDSTSTYDYGGVYHDTTTVYAQSVKNAAQIGISITTAIQSAMISCDIMSPNLASPTFMNMQVSNPVSTTKIGGYQWGCQNSSSTQFTGFSIFTSVSGTLSGSYAVYGYRD